MSRVFTFNGEVENQISIPASAIFDSPTAVTLAAWVNVSDYGAGGFPVVVKDPLNGYETYLYVNSDGTITGAAGGQDTHSGAQGVTVNNPGTGYAFNDLGVVNGGSPNGHYHIFGVDGGGGVTDVGMDTFGGGYTLGQVCTTTPSSGGGSGLTVHVSQLINKFGASTSVETIPLGVATHIAMTWLQSNGTIHLYINGVECTYASQVTSQGTDDTTGGYEIGSDGFGDAGVEAISEVAIYSTALSALQIAALAASTDGATGSPIGYWHLCGDDSPEPDASGNGNDGVLSDPPPTQGPDSPGYDCSPVGPTTRNTVGVGAYGGNSLAEAFFNPHGLDILQVVNEGGDVVWSLAADGTAQDNPSTSTPKALLGRFEGESFVLAFPNPQGDNVLQIVGQGDTIVFWIDSTGAAGTP